VAKFAELGVYSEPSSIAATADFIAKQRRLWAGVVQDAGIKPQ